jgi:hypothetical protein
MNQLESMPRDLAVVQRSVDQLTEKQEQMARNIAALRSAEHDIKKKRQRLICRVGRNSIRGTRADNHGRLDTSRSYQWRGGLGRA